MTAMTAMTINIPTPIPALKMPPMTSQLENENKIIESNENFKILFCMISVFFGLLKVLIQQINKHCKFPKRQIIAFTAFELFFTKFSQVFI